MKAVIKKDAFILGKNIKLANDFYSRLIGLMFVKEMKGMDGLLIEDCKSIHNCFVRFPIDVIFLSKDNRVVKVIREFKPWRFSWIYFKAKRVLELPVHTVPASLTAGDEIEVLGV